MLASCYRTAINGHIMVHLDQANNNIKQEQEYSFNDY